MPLGGRSFRFVFSAAGFIATRTLGSSPGVRMSWSAKWSWKPETPGSDPAGARISAGKSGSVEMSLPRSAVSEVNCEPVSCMPSPESPAKRTITCESCSTGLLGTLYLYSGRSDLWGTGIFRSRKNSAAYEQQDVPGGVADGHAAVPLLRLLPLVGDARGQTGGLVRARQHDRRLQQARGAR